ncbi:hypothetical protein LCGC14_1853530 [marine sediment metagenome]|uniref:Uncharacterized protein n=1 Tax=marine sediment metagenome TaxID=412755 RepID=A0A0F9IP67_9ZZZZ
MKSPDWRTLPLVAKPPPVMVVAFEIKGPPIITDGQGENFTYMAKGVPLHALSAGRSPR